MITDQVLRSLRHAHERDRKRERRGKAGMGTGLKKQFKQVLDEQEKRWKRDKDHERRANDVA